MSDESALGQVRYHKAKNDNGNQAFTEADVLYGTQADTQTIFANQNQPDQVQDQIRNAAGNRNFQKLIVSIDPMKSFGKRFQCIIYSCSGYTKKEMMNIMEHGLD